MATAKRKRVPPMRKGGKAWAKRAAELEDNVTAPTPSQLRKHAETADAVAEFLKRGGKVTRIEVPKQTPESQARPWRDPNVAALYGTENQPRRARETG